MTDSHPKDAPQTIEQAALSALLAWNAARQEVNRLKAERDSHRCTEACAGDFETGDPGQGPCWRNGPTDDMCDPCREHVKCNEPIPFAKRRASELRQKMQRQAVRLQKHFAAVRLEASSASETEIERLKALVIAQQQEIEGYADRLTALLLRAEAAEARQPAPEWQPIETAPKDGTHIVAWLSDVQRVAIICWTLIGSRSRWYEFGAGGCEPTHWMPLPDPPKDLK